MKTNKQKFKAELLLVLAIILISAGIYLYMNVLMPSNGAKVQILVDGLVTQEYDLYKSQTIVVETENGGQNILVIDNGSCYLDDANCPDKLCVHQGTISKAGQSIICLPHKLVIKIVGGEEQDVDTST